jgi:hypothetical protein
MTSLSRRIATTVVSGAIAVAALTGCGLIGGSALDCAAISSTMQEVSSNLQADEATFKASVDKLRAEANDIGDADLKQAILDYAALAEQVNAFTNDPEGNMDNIPDASNAQSMVTTIQEKCQAL